MDDKNNEDKSWPKFTRHGMLTRLRSRENTSGEASTSAASGSNDGRSSPEICTICLEPLQDPANSNNCTHIFCFECLERWCEVKSECPLCKTRIRQIISRTTGRKKKINPYPSWMMPSSISGFHTQVQREYFVDPPPRYLDIQSPAIPLFHNPGIDPLNPQNVLHNHSQFPNIMPVSSDFSLSEERQLFRRRVYDDNLWILFPTNNNNRFRDFSPSFYHENPVATARIRRWLARELRAAGVIDRTTALNMIIQNVRFHNIHSEEFLCRVEYLFRNRAVAEHFVHEFYHFASSPHEMELWDNSYFYTNNPDRARRATHTSDAPIVIDLEREEEAANATIIDLTNDDDPSSPSPHSIEDIDDQPSTSTGIRHNLRVKLVRNGNSQVWHRFDDDNSNSSFYGRPILPYSEPPDVIYLSSDDSDNSNILDLRAHSALSNRRHTTAISISINIAKPNNVLAQPKSPNAQRSLEPHNVLQPLVGGVNSPLNDTIEQQQSTSIVSTSEVLKHNEENEAINRPMDPNVAGPNVFVVPNIVDSEMIVEDNSISEESNQLIERSESFTENIGMGVAGCSHFVPESELVDGYMAFKKSIQQNEQGESCNQPVDKKFDGCSDYIARSIDAVERVFTDSKTDVKQATKSENLVSCNQQINPNVSIMPHIENTATYDNDLEETKHVIEESVPCDQPVYPPVAKHSNFALIIIPDPEEVDGDNMFLGSNQTNGESPGDQQMDQNIAKSSDFIDPNNVDSKRGVADNISKESNQDNKENMSHLEPFDINIAGPSNYLPPSIADPGSVIADDDTILNSITAFEDHVIASMTEILEFHPIGNVDSLMNLNIQSDPNDGLTVEMSSPLDALNPPARQNTVIDILSSDEEDVQVVGVLKPRAERTPEIVDLSSEEIIEISSDEDIRMEFDTSPGTTDLVEKIMHDEELIAAMDLRDSDQPAVSGSSNVPPSILSFGQKNLPALYELPKSKNHASCLSSASVSRNKWGRGKHIYISSASSLSSEDEGKSNKVVRSPSPCSDESSVQVKKTVGSMSSSVNSASTSKPSKLKLKKRGNNRIISSRSSSEDEITPKQPLPSAVGPAVPVSSKYQPKIKEASSKSNSYLFNNIKPLGLNHTTSDPSKKSAPSTSNNLKKLPPANKQTAEKSNHSSIHKHKSVRMKVGNFSGNTRLSPSSSSSSLNLWSSSEDDSKSDQNKLSSLNNTSSSSYPKTSSKMTSQSSRSKTSSKISSGNRDRSSSSDDETFSSKKRQHQYSKSRPMKSISSKQPFSRNKSPKSKTDNRFGNESDSSSTSDQTSRAPKAQADKQNMPSTSKDSYVLKKRSRHPSHNSSRDRINRLCMPSTSKHSDPRDNSGVTSNLRAPEPSECEKNPLRRWHSEIYAPGNRLKLKSVTARYTMRDQSSENSSPEPKRRKHKKNKKKRSDRISSDSDS